MQAAPMDRVQNKDFHTQHRPRMVAEIITQRERYRKRHTSSEILLGRRTVMEYLLSPVKKAFHEAGRER